MTSYGTVLGLGSGTRLLRGCLTAAQVAFWLAVLIAARRVELARPVPWLPSPPTRTSSVTLVSLAEFDAPPKHASKSLAGPRGRKIAAPGRSAQNNSEAVDEFHFEESAAWAVSAQGLGSRVQAGPWVSGGGFGGGPGEEGSGKGGEGAGAGSRLARPVDFAWDCPWPDENFLREARVTLEVEVSAAGRALRTRVLQATRADFAELGSACAMRQSFRPAHDLKGSAISGWTRPVPLHYFR